MRNLPLIIACGALMLPLSAGAADSTDYSRENTDSKSAAFAGCHPDYSRGRDHADGRPFPGKGWMHIEIRTKPDSVGNDEQVRLRSPDGSEAGFWRHADIDRDIFQVFAPVLSGQYTEITGSYEAVTTYRYLPCMRK